MRGPLLLLAILQIAFCSFCPSGQELVSKGQCRGLLTTLNLYWDERAVNTAIEKCDEIDSNPVIIHNAEQQKYWTDRAWLVIALVCDPKSTKWMWTDRSPVDYRPPKYHSALDKPCKGGCSWDILDTGEWNFICNGQETYTTKIYCTYDVPQPVPSGDGCQAFQDDRDDGICFQIGKTAASWQEAQHICMSFGGELASIHNSKENNFIRRLAVANGAVSSVYLGARTKNGVTKWTDGSVWDYNNFYQGFPMNGLGECIAMDTSGTSGQWVNTECSSKQAVACQRKQNYTAPSCSSGPWLEGDILYSPGFPLSASTPCDFILKVADGKRVELERCDAYSVATNGRCNARLDSKVLILEANSCCDHLVISENYIGGEVLADLTGEVNDKIYRTKTSNFMKVSWQPKGGVNVLGVMFTFRAV